MKKRLILLLIISLMICISVVSAETRIDFSTELTADIQSADSYVKNVTVQQMISDNPDYQDMEILTQIAGYQDGGIIISDHNQKDIYYFAAAARIRTKQYPLVSELPKSNYDINLIEDKQLRQILNEIDDIHKLSSSIGEYYTNDMNSFDATFKTKETLESMGIKSNITSGFHLIDGEWAFGVWLHVFDKETFIAADLYTHEYGTLNTPHIIIKEAEKYSDKITFYSAEKKDAELSVTDYSVDISGIEHYDELSNIEVSIFPLSRTIKAGSTNVVTLKIRNNNDFFYFFEADYLGNRGYFSVSPHDMIYYDIIIDNIDTEEEYVVVDIRLNNKEFSTGFSIDKMGSEYDYDSATDYISKKLRINNKPSLQDFKRVLAKLENTDQLYEQFIETHDNIVIEKNINDNQVEITLNPKKKLYNISIYENIPKCLAKKVSEMYSEIEFEIIEDDPVIAWHIDELDKKTTIKYDLADMDITDCSDESMTLLIAKRIGESASTIRILPIIISVIIATFLIAGIIIYFARFSKE